VRSEPRSFSASVRIIVQGFEHSLRLQALSAVELTTAIFQAYGIRAKPSQAGLVTTRLISQMGDLQGCRVFKVTGVRELVAKSSPDEAFTRSFAKTTIRPAGEKGRLLFGPFEDLFIEARPPTTKLNADQIFDFLLRRDVFRVGLNLICPHCKLRYWLPLDDIKTHVTCQYCGTPFSITDQLRDRDWAFRRSGLFGLNDNQHGGIPVAVTLQQLDTAFTSKRMLYTTSLELQPDGAAMDRCETDLVVITDQSSQLFPDRPQIAIAECKSAGGEVSIQDAMHLARVADALPARRLTAFVLFAKTGTFSEAEIAACALAQTQFHSRVILLSKDELEPYHQYERHPNLPIGGRNFEHMAEITTRLYPSLQPRGQQSR
jgi:hypothetical protein